MIHRAVEAVGSAEVLAPRHLREEGIAWRAAHALANAVRDPHHQHVPGRRRRRDQRTRERRQRIAAHDQGLAPAHAVGDPARRQLEEAGHGLRQPLHEPDEGGPRAENAGEERRQQRIDHLAAGVREQADEPETPDRRRERRQLYFATCPDTRRRSSRSDALTTA